MKTLLRFGAPLALSLGLLTVPGSASAETWEFDPGHSRVGFAVRHLMVSNVRGHFKKWAGTIELDDKDPTKSKVEVSIDVDSISTDDDKRDAHLKSPDFFDSAKFPKMTFKSTKITKDAKGYKVLGDLTIKDKTKPVTLVVEGPSKAVKDPWGNTKSGASVTGTINRKEFGLVWNMPLEGGGIAVGDDVKLEIETELLKKK